MKLYIVLTALLFHTSLALSDEVLELADKLLEQKNYGEAITEYQRFLFFNPKSKYQGHALYRLGLAYRAEKDWSNAVNCLKISTLEAKGTPIAEERRIALTTALMASGNYSLARLELIRILEYSTDESLRIKALYYDSIASLYMFDRDAINRSFSTFYSEYENGKMNGRAGEISLILQENQESYKSIGLAKFLSTILPGLGQTYAGDWQDGLNAFLINGVTIGLLANAVYRKSYTNAAIMFPIVMRYYMGNRYWAEIDARKYNESLDRQSRIDILNLVRIDEP